MTFRTQSRVTPGVPGDNSAGATVRNKKGCWISNSRKVSSAAIGADTGKKPERALSKVVLPEPISPAIIRLPARLEIDLVCLSGIGSDRLVRTWYLFQQGW